jgi:hypothetical protein
MLLKGSMESGKRMGNDCNTCRDHPVRSEYVTPCPDCTAPKRGKGGIPKERSSHYAKIVEWSAPHEGLCIGIAW